LYISSVAIESDDEGFTRRLIGRFFILSIRDSHPPVLIMRRSMDPMLRLRMNFLREDMYGASDSKTSKSVSVLIAYSPSVY
jgi:hypothetical protein